MKVFIFILLLFSKASYSISYKEIRCNRLEKEQREREVIIQKLDKVLGRIMSVLKHDKADKKVNRHKYLRKYKNLAYKQQRLKRKSERFPEDIVMRGCPLI